VGARHCIIEKLDQMSRLTTFREQLEESLEYARPAKPPESLPYAVLFPNSLGMARQVMLWTVK
jgi:hypothetical protein